MSVPIRLGKNNQFTGTSTHTLSAMEAMLSHPEQVAFTFDQMDRLLEPETVIQAEWFAANKLLCCCVESAAQLGRLLRDVTRRRIIGVDFFQVKQSEGSPSMSDAAAYDALWHSVPEADHWPPLPRPRHRTFS